MVEATQVVVSTSDAVPVSITAEIDGTLINTRATDRDWDRTCQRLAVVHTRPVVLR